MAAKAEAGLEENRIRFIKQHFSNYYAKRKDEMVLPHGYERREYGFLLFHEKIMVRHKAFKNKEELLNYILSIVPSDVYYSSAYYSKPWEDMEHKGWLGADLCFDIDADHIPTRCKALHDMWICNSCRIVQAGTKPKTCPNCASDKVEEKPWFCDECLEAAKRELLRLADVLEKDFGIDGTSTETVFSGHRGYHLHARSEEVLRLDEEARKEIVDYIMAVGLRPESHGLYKEWGGPWRGPQRHEPGWRGRLADGIYKVISESDLEELLRLGIPKRTAHYIIDNKKTILAELKERIPWERLPDLLRVPPSAFKKFINSIIEGQALSVRIDTVVTTDVHRLIRLPGTLNGKTGFKATRLLAGDLSRFDPFYDAVAFKEKGFVRVFVKSSPGFRVGDETFGPYREEVVEMPIAAALLLACKGLGYPVGNGVR